VSAEREVTGHDSANTAAYRGRFAPSPTGPLHFGSLVAAVASHLQALVAGGDWLLRIEDIDPPREIEGAAEQIIESLAAHGFQWSGSVLYQRHNQQNFDAISRSLLDSDLAFACSCSRAQIRKTARMGAVGPIYPGTCRDKIDLKHGPHSIRVRTMHEHISFEDALQGQIDCELDEDIGDFIIRRKDGLIAYSLAGALDDHAQGITEVVRGMDLLHFTPAQIFLQRLLGLRTPDYMHVPIAVTEAGDKLSKQTGARPLDNRQPANNLFRCLEFLRQAPPPALRTEPVEAIWSWARSHWEPRKLANCRKIPIQHINVFY